MPVAVEARDGAAIDSDQEGLEGLLARCWNHERQASKHEDAPRTIAPKPVARTDDKIIPSITSILRLQLFWHDRRVIN
jgi:hypothetical protein